MRLRRPSAATIAATTRSGGSHSVSPSSAGMQTPPPQSAEHDQPCGASQLQTDGAHPCAGFGAADVPRRARRRADRRSAPGRARSAARSVRTSVARGRHAIQLGLRVTSRPGVGRKSARRPAGPRLVLAVTIRRSARVGERRIAALRASRRGRERGPARVVVSRWHIPARRRTPVHSRKIRTDR